MNETIANDNTEVVSPEKTAARQFIDMYLVAADDRHVAQHTLFDWYETLRVKHDWPDIGFLELARLLRGMGCSVRSRLHIEKAAGG